MYKTCNAKHIHAVHLISHAQNLQHNLRLKLGQALEVLRAISGFLLAHARTRALRFVVEHLPVSEKKAQVVTSTEVTS